jgi:hypothetical protein
VNFPGFDLQVDAFEDFFALNGGVQVFDAQHLYASLFLTV